MMRVKNPLNPDDDWGLVNSVVPPTGSFPYWAIYYANKDGKFSQMAFYHIDKIQALMIQSDEEDKEVKENGIRNNKMPNVLSEYSDITRGGE